MYPYSFRLVKVGLKSEFLRRDKFIGSHNHVQRRKEHRTLPAVGKTSGR
jgi:hypothetical protein